MTVDALLSKLGKVKSTGTDTWTASCPAHDDKRPSLTIRETDNGTVLLKCWSGCSAHDVVAAVGLQMTDLFPPKLSRIGPPLRRPFPALDVLRGLGRESLIVAVGASRLGNGGTLTAGDRERLLLAASRIQEAIAGGDYAAR